jgi:hypothetical protein
MFGWIKTKVCGFRFWDAACGRVVRAKFLVGLILGWIMSGFRIWGVYEVKCFASDGRLRWRAFAPNAITNEGLNHILSIVLGAGTQITTWYLGLIDNSGFTAFSASDTMASHGGWTEVTNYTQANRVTWSPAAAASQSITNTSTSNFSGFAATKTIKGLFLTSNNTKGGTTGTLFSEAAFSGGNQTVNSGDTLQCTYTVNAATS